jgi:hypothetical protein
MLRLVVALLVGQVIYEWVDEKGETHFSDDVSTIPATAKRRVTTGADIMVTPAAPKSDAGVRSAPTGPDSCARAKAQVDLLEKQLVQEKQDFERLQEAEGLACQRHQGAPGRYAQCMANRSTAPKATGTADQLEAARESLRRVQVSGCQ